MKETILSNYNGEKHLDYKRQWKQAFRTVSKSLGLQAKTSHKDDWSKICEELPEPSSGSSIKNSGSSTSSLKYQKPINSYDRVQLKEIHEKIGKKMGAPFRSSN